MDKLKKKVSILIILLSSILIAQAKGAEQTGFILYSDRFGLAPTDRDHWILLDATSGMLNSSDTILQLTNTGYLAFLSNETVTFTLSYNGYSGVFSKLNNTERIGQENESSITVPSNTWITLYWAETIMPYVPYMFILGMIGLVSMFGGPILAIKMMKENPRWALTQGIMFTVLGIGLFMAWLSS